MSNDLSDVVLPLNRRSVLAAAVSGLTWRPGLAAIAQPDASQALHILGRLGFGPAPGDLDRVMRMGVDAWIAQQFQPDTIALPASLDEQLDALDASKLSQREVIQRYRQAAQTAKAAAKDSQAPPKFETRTTGRGDKREMVQAFHVEAAESRLFRAVSSPRQLEEVLVSFWFNHFNVFEGKGLDRMLIQSYEREAIRPHVFGSFRSLLGATAKHPAMLFYLDNWLSVAPGFQPRRPNGRPLSGLNENYAREVMELHTLGVDAGYTQQDVTELARILTGWTMMPIGGRRGAVGDSSQSDGVFVFDPERHDRGSKTWLRHTVTQAGQAEGEFALDVLARHAATARHISTQLARHFVADEPSPALVDRLSRRFGETDGNLRAVMRSLVDSPEFRDQRSVKFKTPYQFVVSAVRASGIAVSKVRPLLAALRDLGQPLYGCQTPDGYKDTQADWLNPNAMTQRVNFATALASGRLPLIAATDADTRSTPPVNAAALLATLGPSISDKTRASVENTTPALRSALVLGSPDFMRR